jgi:putative addiction module component (TIGR02574 family)
MGQCARFRHSEGWSERKLTGILALAILYGMSELIPELALLSPRQRLDLIEALWGSLDDNDVPVTEAQRAELDRRIAGFEQDQEQSISWDQLSAAGGSAVLQTNLFVISRTCAGVNQLGNDWPYITVGGGGGNSLASHIVGNHGGAGGAGGNPGSAGYSASADIAPPLGEGGCGGGDNQQYCGTGSSNHSGLPGLSSINNLGGGGGGGDGSEPNHGIYESVQVSNPEVSVDIDARKRTRIEFTISIAGALVHKPASCADGSTNELATGFDIHVGSDLVRVNVDGRWSCFGDELRAINAPPKSSRGHRE